MLKKRVLEIAINEINEKTDIIVSYDLEKIGRMTTAIFFTMKPKPDTKKDDSLVESIREKLRFYGVKPDIINDLMQKHDLEYLLANLKIVEEQLPK